MPDLKINRRHKTADGCGLCSLFLIIIILMIIAATFLLLYFDKTIDHQEVSLNLMNKTVTEQLLKRHLIDLTEEKRVLNQEKQNLTRQVNQLELQMHGLKIQYQTLMKAFNDSQKEKQMLQIGNADLQHKIGSLEQQLADNAANNFDPIVDSSGNKNNNPESFWLNLWSNGAASVNYSVVILTVSLSFLFTRYL